MCRRIWENFAYVQMNTVWSTVLCLYEFDLTAEYFPPVKYTAMIHIPENPVVNTKMKMAAKKQYGKLHCQLQKHLKRMKFTR